jgi:1-acyl-sn-glycerol-3-phosphate acyltransferase
MQDGAPHPAPPAAAAAKRPLRAAVALTATATAERHAEPPRAATRPPALAAAELAALAASPFVDVAHPITAREALKMAALAPLAIVRLAAILAAVVISSGPLALLARLYPRIGAPLPPRLRRAVYRYVRAWASIALLCCGFVRVRVRGARNLAAARACRTVVVFNHESWVDPLLLGALLPPCIVAKAGAADLPLLKFYAYALRFVFVARRGSADRAHALTAPAAAGAAAAVLTARAADGRFPLVAVAPEATTKAQACLLRFRSGAFEAGRPIAPVLIRYCFRRFNPRWGVENMAWHFWRMLSQVANHAEVEFLQVRFPSAAERGDARLFANNVRSEMAAALGVPLVDAGVAEDRALARLGVTTDWRGARVVQRASARGPTGAVAPVSRYTTRAPCQLAAAPSGA